MKIQDSIALVTGANRGLGLAFVQELLAAGVKKVYAAARDPSSINIPGVHPVKLDVTNAQDILDVAKAYPDVNLLINNAGIIREQDFLSENAIQAARDQFETNFFGPLALSQAFAPTLKQNGGGAIVNVLSVASWVNLSGAATYSASKAAAWALSNGLRVELHNQGTQVLALHVGYMDTDMAKGVHVPKAKPEDVARQVIEALEAGKTEVLADEFSAQIKQGLSLPAGTLEMMLLSAAQG
jgi:NAD(P)-dependent dehydrogenase (short-subunit alcohol dehydrogenase family)